LPFDRHQAAKTKLDEDPRVAAFRDDVRSRSMDLVHGRIPAKIIELHTLYKVRVQGEPIAAALHHHEISRLCVFCHTGLTEACFRDEATRGDGRARR
jgi:hypothetical protein